jgi:integrase
VAERVVLTDKLLRGLAPGDKRFDLLDALVPGLLACVHPSGSITLQLRSRLGANSPIRRAIGRHGQITVEQARRTARHWLELLHAGGDPQAELRKERAATARTAAATFGAVFEQFVARKLNSQRRGHAVEAAIRRDLLPAWHHLPLAEISHREVRDAIEKVIERGAAAYAHNVLDAARALFAYALERDLIEANPCDRLKRQSVIGPKVSRERVLTDDELKGLWRASTRLRYPYAGVYQLLMLTGARLNEIAEMHWREVDLERATFTVPAARFKTGQQHEIPLSADAVTILRSLPRFRRGDYVFSSNFGERSVNSFSKVKRRLDRRMLRTLRALARARGDDPRTVELRAWCNHDIRRSVRSRLSALRVPDVVSELVIGHQRRGIMAVYDRHQYASEKAEALSLWAAALRTIVAPTRSNVVMLRAGEG